MVTSLDFDSEGERIATIDGDGVCLITDVNTDKYLVGIIMTQGGGCKTKLSSDY